MSRFSEKARILLGATALLSAEAQVDAKPNKAPVQQAEKKHGTQTDKKSMVSMVPQRARPVAGSRAPSSGSDCEKVSNKFQKVSWQANDAREEERTCRREVKAKHEGKGFPDEYIAQTADIWCSTQTEAAIKTSSEAETARRAASAACNKHGGGS